MATRTRAGVRIGTYAFAVGAELLRRTDADCIPGAEAAERIESADDGTAERIIAAGVTRARLEEAASRIRVAATSRRSLVAFLLRDAGAQAIPLVGTATWLDGAHQRAAVIFVTAWCGRIVGNEAASGPWAACRRRPCPAAH